MDSKNSDSIFLTDLAKGFPAITPVFEATLAEACAVCLSLPAYVVVVEFSKPIAITAKK